MSMSIFNITYMLGGNLNPPGQFFVLGLATGDSGGHFYQFFNNLNPLYHTIPDSKRLKAVLPFIVFSGTTETGGFHHCL